jgi:ABC-2 type transport system permease protein
MGGLGGLVIVSVIVSFVFGREYAEGTAKNMLALPIPRRNFVFAKIIVSAVWFAALTLWLLVAACVAGGMVGLSGLTPEMVTETAIKLIALAAMSLSCAMLVAWVAVETKGYFAPLGFTIFTMMLGSVFGRTGWAPWVPWCVVGISSGAAGPGIELGWGSYATLIATFVVGTALTVRHETEADNVQ